MMPHLERYLAPLIGIPGGLLIFYLWGDKLVVFWMHQLLGL